MGVTADFRAASATLVQGGMMHPRDPLVFVLLRERRHFHLLRIITAFDCPRKEGACGWVRRK